MRYRLVEGRLVNEAGEPLHTDNVYRSTAPYVVSDTPAYRSPITGALIDGKRERIEDLKKHDCVALDPPTRPRPYKNKSFTEKRGLPLEG